MKGQKWSDEVKKKISKSQKARYQIHPVSEESRKKTSERLKGKKKELSRAWKGGISNTTRGRILIYDPANPLARKGGYVLRARLVYQQAHPEMKSTDVIHHIDGDVSNDAIENLVCFPNDKEHHKEHYTFKDRVSQMSGCNSPRA